MSPRTGPGECDATWRARLAAAAQQDDVKASTMTDPERDHLLARLDELDGARRRWKMLALAGTPILFLLLLLAVANAVSSSLTLRDVVKRERQAQQDAQEMAERAAAEAEMARAHAVEALRQAELAQRAAEEKVPARPLSLSLEVAEQEIKAGTIPTFRLTVKNASREPQKVLDIRERRDLQDTYYDLEITTDGKPVKLPRAISDPGPIANRDFLALPPQESITFVLKDFPVDLKELPPGSYQASVRFWQDPYQSSRTSYRSREATFTVLK
jgi:hypothetical protein